MKKFIHTWFGIGIFNEEWYEHRVVFFENITLPSFKTGEFREDIYWVIYLDSSIPIQWLRYIQRLVKDVNVNVTIRTIDFYYEMVPDFKKTIRQFCDSDNEFCLQVRLDADDAINFEAFELFENNSIPNTEQLISFEDLYYLQLDTLNYSEYTRPFMALNMCYITNDKDRCIFQAPHNKLCEWAVENNILVEKIKFDKPYFIRTLFPDQDSGAHAFFNETRVDFVADSVENMLKDFNITYKTLKQEMKICDFTVKFDYKWDYHSTLVKESYGLYNKIQTNKREYLTYREKSIFQLEIEKITDFSLYCKYFMDTINDEFNVYIIAHDDASSSFFHYRDDFEKLGLFFNLKVTTEFQKPFILFKTPDYTKCIYSEGENKLKFINENVKMQSNGFKENSVASYIKGENFNFMTKKRGLSILFTSLDHKCIDFINIDTYGSTKKINR